MTGVNLAIGPSCFVRCRGCYNHFGNTAKSGRLITATELLDFVAEARDIGVEQATISGGDPLTHPEIVTIVREISGLGLKVKLDTVGTTFLSDAPVKFFGKGVAKKVEITELAPHVHTLGLPLDGSTEESRKNFRVGRPHLVSESLRIAALAKAAGLRVCINTVVHKLNIAELPAIMDLVRASGVDEWQLFEFQPIGPLGSRASDLLELPPGQFDTVSSELLARNEAQHDTRLVCKNRHRRASAYFMVDDAGIAWIPGDSGDNRTVIGHIMDERRNVIDRLRRHVLFRNADP